MPLLPVWEGQTGWLLGRPLPTLIDRGPADFSTLRVAALLVPTSLYQRARARPAPFMQKPRYIWSLAVDLTLYNSSHSLVPLFFVSMIND